METIEREMAMVARHLAAKQKMFDDTERGSREAIRASAQAITLIHNGDIRRARALLASLEKSHMPAIKEAARHSNSALQALQEHAEASILLGIKDTGRIPSMRSMRLMPEAYLLGLMDVVGELKREMFEALRRRDVDAASAYLEMMRRIYDSTRSIRFAEAVLRGFRRKQDVARNQIESAEGELLRFI